MKNRRNVCAATEAGYIQYNSLPEANIKSGCQLSPLQTSNYCYYHAPRMSLSKPESSSATDTTEEGIVKCIMGKKFTRQKTYYQVCTQNIINVLQLLM